MTALNRLPFLAAAVATTVVCFGATAPARAAEQTADVAATTQPAEAPKVAEKKYCVAFDLTGSRVARKVCKTQSQWAAEGVDVTKK